MHAVGRGVFRLILAISPILSSLVPPAKHLTSPLSLHAKSSFRLFVGAFFGNARYRAYSPLSPDSDIPPPGGGQGRGINPTRGYIMVAPGWTRSGLPGDGSKNETDPQRGSICVTVGARIWNPHGVRQGMAREHQTTQTHNQSRAAAVRKARLRIVPLVSSGLGPDEAGPPARPRARAAFSPPARCAPPSGGGHKLMFYGEFREKCDTPCAYWGGEKEVSTRRGIFG